MAQAGKNKMYCDDHANPADRTRTGGHQKCECGCIKFDDSDVCCAPCCIAESKCVHCGVAL